MALTNDEKELRRIIISANPLPEFIDKILGDEEFAREQFKIYVPRFVKELDSRIKMLVDLEIQRAKLVSIVPVETDENGEVCAIISGG